MKYLVLKDFRVTGKIYLFLFAISIIFSSMGMFSDNGMTGPLMYMLAIAMSTTFPQMIIVEKDIKHDTHSFFNSLPILRSDIVVSRYIFVSLNIIIATLFIYFYTNVSKIFLAGNPMTILNTLIIATLLFMFFSVNLLITFFDVEKARYLNQIFYVSIILIPSLTSRLLDTTNLGEKLKYIAKFDLNTIFAFALVFSIIAYIVSMQISKSIYKRKDF